LILGQSATQNSALRLFRPQPSELDIRSRLAAAFGNASSKVTGGLTPKKRLNLALQGGGAHGAFTWGALDALLENNLVEIDGISGTSSGAVNAVALAAGLMDGGIEGARDRLNVIWTSISRSGAPGSHPDSPLAYSPAAAISGAIIRRSLEKLGSEWSPYDLNPLNINPLREILLANIDFDKLRRESPVKLFIAATEVTSGRTRIFGTKDISVDAVMASACLPTLFSAVRIGRFHYWDGGFSANPDLLTLISETDARDTLLVQISPDRDPDQPVSSEKITSNISRLTFNQPLRSQIEKIELYRRIPRIPFLVERSVRRLGKHHFHLVDGSQHTVRLRANSKSRADWPMIEGLHNEGRAMAHNWLGDHFQSIGKCSTVDLYAKYFTDRIPFD
jgi:NTE family protein